MIQIKLTKGKIALIDDEDFECVSKFNWYASYNGYVFYARTSINNTKMYLHKFITNILGKQKVDHKNGNTLDCRKENLRPCTSAQNSQNQKIRTDNTSGYKGVSYVKKRNKFSANICSNRKVIFLGLFETAEEAALVYNKFAIKLHNEFARLK